MTINEINEQIIKEQEQMIELLNARIAQLETELGL